MMFHVPAASGTGSCIGDLLSGAHTDGLFYLGSTMLELLATVLTSRRMGQPREPASSIILSITPSLLIRCGCLNVWKLGVRALGIHAIQDVLGKHENECSQTRSLSERVGFTIESHHLYGTYILSNTESCVQLG